LTSKLNLTILRHALEEVAGILRVNVVFLF
jgi:hypothetical protein